MTAIEEPPKKPPQSIPAKAAGTEGAPKNEGAPFLAEVARSGEVDDPDDEEVPSWLQQAPLAELLLWRLGVPADRERLEQIRQREQDAIKLTPPLTTRKVADAIAKLSVRLMNGELDPASAKASLYALQTLLTALRLQLVEEKKQKDAKKKNSKAPRRKHANRKR